VNRILVVDDEPRIVAFVQRALASAGFSVDGARTGARGLQLARSGGYDLVVLDLLMPGIDGVRVLEGIIQSRPQQRVLVLSAVNDVESKVRCLEIGALDYLPKPFATAELVARIRARLRQPTGQPLERELRTARVTLDLVRRKADAGHGPVALAQREFLLLQYLMRQGGEVCSREAILAEVWGYSFDPGSNIVDVYVRRLRGKLGWDLIETVRSVGYRLDDT
jgi:two-component system OmpR family response regulator